VRGSACKALLQHTQQLSLALLSPEQRLLSGRNKQRLLCTKRPRCCLEAAAKINQPCALNLIASFFLPGAFVSVWQRIVLITHSCFEHVNRAKWLTSAGAQYREHGCKLLLILGAENRLERRARETRKRWGILNKKIPALKKVWGVRLFSSFAGSFKFCACASEPYHKFGKNVLNIWIASKPAMESVAWKSVRLNNSKIYALFGAGMHKLLSRLHLNNIYCRGTKGPFQLFELTPGHRNTFPFTPNYLSLSLFALTSRARARTIVARENIHVWRGAGIL